LKLKKNKAAFEIYKMNYDKFPNDVTTNFGMIKAYAAVGNKTEALKFADKTIALINDKSTKEYLEKIKQHIKDGKDISNL
jgi:ketol-acid reductoisomerase